MLTKRVASARPRTGVLALLAALAAAVVAVLALPADRAVAASAPSGLHVSGNRLLTGSGTPVVLRGVDRAGSEYQCLYGSTFDGPSTDASIAAMASWHINAVRVPLNEDCWLGINGLPSGYSAGTYRSDVRDYVTRLHAAGLVAILDLHWTAAGTNQSTGQQNLPDADHANAFWTSVAGAFKSDGSAVFDLFNEPHDVSWTCWRDGGDCGLGYQVAGMQSLLNSVRATGATNPVLVGGLAYANDLSQWLTYRPRDSAGNVMASWHSYNFNACSTTSCWDSQIAPVAASVPLVTGEVGENDCAHGYLDSVLPWLDGHNAGYLGWGWATHDCAGFPALISNYDGTPTAFGAGLRDHLAALAGGASGKLKTTPSSDTSKAPYHWQEDLDLVPSSGTSKLTVTIKVKKTSGITPAGFSDTAQPGALTTSESTGSSALVYTATLNPGYKLPAGKRVRLAVLFNGTGSPHAVSGDTYSLHATVGGRSATASGHF